MSTSPDLAASDVTQRPTAVIGAGTLGRRIALMLATQGGDVRVFDTSEEQKAGAVAFIDGELPNVLEDMPTGAAGRVAASNDLEEAVAGTWLVVEALPERLDVKEQIFG